MRDHDLLEIPYAVRWLVPKGERWANFPLLNDNDTQLEYYRRFGHIYAVGVPTKKWRLVVVSDPELLDEVAANEELFGKRVEELNFFDQLARTRGRGTSVIGDGPEYERIRRVMLPWYSPQNQRTQFGLMKEQARKLVDAWAALPDDDPLDARVEMERYALEVSGRGACNYDFGLLNGGEARPLATAVIESTKESIARVAEPRPDFTLFAGRARRRRRKRYLRHNRELYRTAEVLVRGREHTCPVGQQNDLLTRLLTVPDSETGERLDLDIVRDQILMHMSNGFNGPSITGGWLAYVLATHPEVEEKLLAEIDSISGGDPDYDLQLDDLMRLPYTTQVIKETLRVYPPMPVTIRRSLADGQLGRYRIRKGDVILVGTLAAQRDPRYWGPEPDRFDPEQFAMERVVERPRHAFIPFSVGKRQCMAQEVTFMMLRVVLFEIYNRYRLRLAPGARVVKNTVVTTKPASVPFVRLPRGRRDGLTTVPAEATVAGRNGAHVASGRGWDRPSAIPETSAYRHLVVAYGSNFGTSKELAERFADRSRIYGFTNEVVTLNELALQAPRSAPWLLVVMTPTYTSNPPANAVDFKRTLEHSPRDDVWRHCRYLVWGLGNSQWNAFLAFPRYVHRRLEELGAAPLADFAFADVGSPLWEQAHVEWNDRVWPVLLELAGARPSEEAAERVAAEKSTERALKRTDSNAAMAMSLDDLPPGAPRAPVAPRVLLAPEILTNPAGIETVEARVRVCRDLQAPESPKRTRHLELELPPGFTYHAGDHLGVCPRNDDDRVQRLAARVGAALDGVFLVPQTMDVRAVPKGVVLQVRNVLTNLVDITGPPPLPLLDLLVETASDSRERARVAEIRDVVRTPGGPGSQLRDVVDAGGYDVLQLLDELPSCTLNLYELLQVLPPLRPRYYSASSTPSVHGDERVHLTVGLETCAVPVAPAREFRGVCGGHLHSLREGDRVTVFHDGADGFHLQDDVTKPMIFVSAGTGLAPMRAFLWQRAELERQGVALGEAALFHGLRSRDLDYLYRDEIETFAAEGVLDHLHLVASRERPDRREHVQDRLRAESGLVWRLIEAGGYVYVCGSQPMREGVRATLVDVVCEHAALPREHAEAFVFELETVENRYRPDLWG